MRNLLDDLDRNSTFVGHMRQLADATIEIDKRVEALEAKADGRFDAIDRRFDEVDKKIDAVEQRLEARIDLVHDDVRKTAAHVERLVGYIERVELKKKD